MASQRSFGGDSPAPLSDPPQITDYKARGEVMGLSREDSEVDVSGGEMSLEKDLGNAQIGAAWTLQASSAGVRRTSAQKGFRGKCEVP